MQQQTHVQGILRRIFTVILITGICAMISSSQVMVKDIRSGFTGSFPSDFTNVNGTVFLKETTVRPDMNYGKVTVQMLER
jgi:hypothetical protein